jgi:prepilin-type N-terminal cleavage/methylation domain-containing protein
MIMKTEHTIPSAPVSSGFTLIETMVAISLLSVAIVAPMTLTAQSLKTAYYARDQITASYLAQEGIEGVRAIRDSQILQIAQSPNGSQINLFGPIPVGQNFTVDAHQTGAEDAIATCASTCPPLQTDGTLYGYSAGWTATNFTRTVYACYVQQISPGTCNGTPSDEMHLSVTVTWQTGAFQTRSFSISENLYRWVNDGSGAAS